MWSERIHTFPDPVRSRRPEDEEDGDAPRSERKRLRASHQPWFQDSDGSEVTGVGEGWSAVAHVRTQGHSSCPSPLHIHSSQALESPVLQTQLGPTQTTGLGL